MRILILSYIYAPDQSPRAYRWSAIAERWAAQGRHVEIIAGWKSGDIRHETRNGVVVHRVGGGIIERLRGFLGAGSHRHQSHSAAASAGGTAPATTSLPARLAKAAYRATIKQLLWPDYAFHWYPAAAAKARALVRAGQFDALISVSHPFTAHLVGLAVKQLRPELRWMVDIGDPFSLLDEIPLNNTALYRRLNRRTEARVLRSADAVSVTVERCRADYAKAFPGSSDKIAVIPPLLSLAQGDGDSAPVFAGNGIHLACIGTLYRALRDPGALLELFAALRRSRGDLHLHFFGALNDCGPSFEPFRDEIGRSIHLHGMVPRGEIAAVMRAANILVNISNSTPHQLPSKLVEYVASARPIVNLAANASDSAGPFLAGYPSALTIPVPQGEPPAATVSAVLAFIAAPPPVDRDGVRQFLEPYTIDRVARAYEALIAPTPKHPSPGQQRRRRILVNAIHARAGGGLTYLHHLLPLLAGEPDLDIHLIPHPTQAEGFAALTPAPVIHRLEMPAGWLALLAWEQVVLPLRAWRIGYDVLFSPANFGPLALSRQVIVLQNVLTVGAHEKRIGKRLYWITLRIMTALSLIIARGAVAVSRYAAESAAVRWLPLRRPTIIHHGVADAFSPVPTRTSGAPFLLAVGDLYVQKNLHRLIEAMAGVHRKHPAVTLRIAGQAIDAEYAAELDRLVAALGLAKSVIFLGRCDRAALIDLYRNCAVFVFPSTEESFGMPLVEAMASGAPIVASRSAATPEIAGSAALLCDAEDPADMARAILRVLDDQGLGKTLRQQSLERARAFSWPDCARRTAAVLRDAAS